jgi:ribosome-binding factor A
VSAQARSRRSERVGEQIRAELARLLREEVTDPRIGLVTLTRVDVAPDFSNARVYWSALAARPRAAAEGAKPEPGAGVAADPATQAGLDSAAGFLRSRLAHELPLRRIPELRFLHDPSLAEGAHTLALLRELEGGE